MFFRGIFSLCLIFVWAIGCCLLPYAIVPYAVAAPVSATQATAAVEGFLKKSSRPLGTRMGNRPRTARPRSLDSRQTPLFYVVPVNGGGYVVTSADTEITPVIAIVESGDDLVESADNPLWILLNADLRLRTDELIAQKNSISQSAPSSNAAESQWAELLGQTSPADAINPPAGVASVSDVRIAPFVTSTWSQSTAGGSNVYNYYTPNNYICGCSATAAAQIMRYYRYPTTSVPSITRSCRVDNVATDLTTQGGFYNWDNMPLSPSGTLPYQNQAIGKLTSDAGIAMNMSYTAGASAAWASPSVFINNFSYTSAVSLTQPVTSPTPLAKNHHNAILANLDAKYPVLLNIYNASAGHAVVGDGYGYIQETLYAYWIANSYTVTFAPCGGAPTDPTSLRVAYDLKYGSLPTPERNEEFVFAGWWTEAGGAGKMIADKTVVKLNADQTLYAKWLHVLVTIPEADFAVGVENNAVISVLAGSETPDAKFSVSCLSAGMKFNAKTGLITGTPTAPIKKEIILTIKDGKQSVKRTILLPLSPLPTNLQGKFTGYLGAQTAPSGIFSLAAAKTGKLTAQVLTAHGKLSFKSSCWLSRSESGIVYSATFTNKDKKGNTLATLTIEADSSADWNSIEGLTGTIEIFDSTGLPILTSEIHAQRNSFLDKYNKKQPVPAPHKFLADYIGSYYSSAGAALERGIPPKGHPKETPLDTIKLKSGGAAAFVRKNPTYKVSASCTLLVDGDRTILPIFIPAQKAAPLLSETVTLPSLLP